MYAIGGNQEAARLSGIRVQAFRVIGFMLVGVAAAVVGILLISLSSSYSPNGGASYLLPAFAAVFLGAAVFRPGEFNVPGTVVGVLFLGVIQTGLVMLNFETYVINLVQGGILIAAVLSADSAPRKPDDRPRERPADRGARPGQALSRRAGAEPRRPHRRGGQHPRPAR